MNAQAKMRSDRAPRAGEGGVARKKAHEEDGRGDHRHLGERREAEGPGEGQHADPPDATPFAGPVIIAPQRLGPGDYAEQGKAEELGDGDDDAHDGEAELSPVGLDGHVGYDEGRAGEELEEEEGHADAYHLGDAPTLGAEDSEA